MKRRERRRGGALVMALLTLMIVMLLSGAVLRSLLAARRQSTKAAAALNAAWLAESAVDRALVRLKNDSRYAGETWQVEVADDGDQPITAVARIAVETDDTSGSRINVSAEVLGVTVHKTMPGAEY